MQTAVEIVWWVGLIGALIPTILILREVATLLSTLKGILTLAQITREAAEGIARNVEPGSRLEGAVDPIRRFHEGTRTLVTAAVSIDRSLEMILPAAPDRGK